MITQYLYSLLQSNTPSPPLDPCTSEHPRGGGKEEYAPPPVYATVLIACLLINQRKKQDETLHYYILITINIRIHFEFSNVLPKVSSF